MQLSIEFLCRVLPGLSASPAGVLLALHKAEAVVGRLRMTRPQAIDLARLLISAAK